jgi:hypothetical protein
MTAAQLAMFQHVRQFTACLRAAQPVHQPTLDGARGGFHTRVVEDEPVEHDVGVEHDVR